MKSVSIEIIVQPDLQDVDRKHRTGLKNAAYERLTNAIVGAGFEFISITLLDGS